MNKKDFYTFYFYTEIIGTIIVTIFLCHLFIGCKEAPKDYYSAGEIEVVNSCSDTIWTDNNDTTIITSKDVREYLDSLDKATPLRHMLNAEEAAPHTVKIRVIE